MKELSKLKVLNNYMQRIMPNSDFGFRQSAFGLALRVFRRPACFCPAIVARQSLPGKNYFSLARHII